MMSTTLTPGIYRDADRCVFLVDEELAVWLVDHADGPDDRLPFMVEEIATDDIVPFPCVEREDAAEYRRMVKAERLKTWRDRPSLL
jgi:hypothetical protein